MNIQKVVKLSETKYLIVPSEGLPIIAADGDKPTQELYDLVSAHPEIPTQTYEEYIKEAKNV